MKHSKTHRPRGQYDGLNEPITSNRGSVDKAQSAQEFRARTAGTKAINIQAGPQRGGNRL